MGHYTHAIERGRGLCLDPVRLVDTGWYPVVLWEDDEGRRRKATEGKLVRDKRTATFHAKSLCQQYQRHLDRTGSRLEMEAEARRKAYREARELWLDYRRRLSTERDNMVGLLREISVKLAGSGFDRRVNEILERIGPEVTEPPKPS